MDFYIIEDNTLSTFSKKECDYMLDNGEKLDEVRQIQLETVESVISTYCNNQFPDFLSIDVEGMDKQILESIDFAQASPKVICVEAAEYSPIGAGERRTEMIDFLAAQGYYEYANTNLNTIMVRRDFWFV
jgi:hypothetical protein